jgi:hypothetical protein
MGISCGIKMASVCSWPLTSTFSRQLFTSYSYTDIRKLPTLNRIHHRLVDQEYYFIYICNKISWHYVTRNENSVLGWHKLSPLIHASDLVDGHILPHTTQDSCNKPKPSTQHSPARGQYTSKTSGQIDRQKKETEAYTEPRYHGTRGKIFLNSQTVKLHQKQRSVVLNRKGEF